MKARLSEDERERGDCLFCIVSKQAMLPNCRFARTRQPCNAVQPTDICCPLFSSARLNAGRTDGRASVCLSLLPSFPPSVRLTFSGSHGHGTTLQLGIVKAERDRRQKEGEKPIRSSIGDRAKSTAKITRRFLTFSVASASRSILSSSSCVSGQRAALCSRVAPRLGHRREVMPRSHLLL